MAEARRAVAPLPAIHLDKPIDPKLHRMQVVTSGDGLSLFVPHPLFWPRGSQRLLKKFYTNINKAFSPVPLWVIIGCKVVVAVAAGTYVEALQESRLGQALWAFDSWFPWTNALPNQLRFAYITFNCTVICLFAFTFFHRRILRRLLSYTGWMEETRGRLSVKTKVWGLLLKYWYTRNDVVPTYGYQSSLPALPLPDLKDTVRRYLTSMQSLLSVEEHHRLTEKAATFLASEGPRLQKYLVYKRLTSQNYISEWWRDIVYLRSRDSLMINSNYYGLGFSVFHHTNNQAARAAMYCEKLVEIKIELDRELFPRMMMNNMIPLCMDQYAHVFSTTREPHPEIDKLVRYEDDRSRHIVIIHKSGFYRISAFDPQTGRRMTRLQFEAAINGILARDVITISGGGAGDGTPAAVATSLVFPSGLFPGGTPSSSGVVGGGGASTTPQRLTGSFALGQDAQVGALTALPRNQWAEIRERMMRDRVNRGALRTIESAMFVLCLDDDAAPWDDYTLSSRTFLHGKGHNRWFDKSFNLIITADGNASVNGEHSWGDAPALAHVWETAFVREIVEEENGRGYDKNAEGRLVNVNGDLHDLGVNNRTPSKSSASSSSSSPKRSSQQEKPPPLTYHHAEAIAWNIDEQLSADIDAACGSVHDDIERLQLHTAPFTHFGKGHVKKMKCSPDAFVQMAIQLAYFRDQGGLTQTYESAMTRLYRLGRTETIRTASTESAALVQAMGNPKTTREERLTALQAACKKHAHTTTLANTGRGVDRHLFALYVVAVGSNVDSSFLQSVQSRGWKLSTSQIPQTLAPMEWKKTKVGVRKNQDVWPRPGGGFGPVADDGYGVCYTFTNEDVIFFHVTSQRAREKKKEKNSSTTSSSSKNNKNDDDGGDREKAKDTDAIRMHRRIMDALAELGALFGGDDRQEGDDSHHHSTKKGDNAGHTTDDKKEKLQQGKLSSSTPHQETNRKQNKKDKKDQ